ncbi:MAG: thioredoxin family protein [Pseudomonadota bacterium]|nr:thioredoxin family protein [Pseudomonadota bacterium]MDP1572681.1 thioredoxin family protein [Pseudomonadota bacterium]MDP1906554.1 thioredoxin family protein [Pseudomonadota bacterium]
MGLRAYLACFLLLLSMPGLADPPPGYPFVAHDAGMAQAREAGKPILLYFGRYGCAWCDHVNRKTFTDPGLKQLLTENYALIYVDAEGGKRIRLPSGERLTEGELGARLGAFATPLFVFMTPEGRVIAKIPGFKTVADFQDYDRYVRGGHYRQQTLLEFLGSKP